MQKTHSSKPLEPYLYVKRGSDKPAVVYLRKNIEHDVHDEPDGDHIEFWQADEVIAFTNLPESEIMENFDALWYEAERSEMTESEWRADIDSAILDLMEMAVS